MTGLFLTTSCAVFYPASQFYTFFAELFALFKSLVLVPLVLYSVLKKRANKCSTVYCGACTVLLVVQKTVSSARYTMYIST